MNVMVLPVGAFTHDFAIIDDPSQIHHIKTVLHADVGDTLKIAQLGGKMGVATIQRFETNHCVLSEVRLFDEPPAKLDLTVMLALPRPKVLRRLVLDMTVFGVGHIILINSARTDKSYWHSPLLDRLDEFVLEGLQQGVDCVTPTITLAHRFKPFVQDELPALIADQSAVVLHPYAQYGFHDTIERAGLPSFVAIGAEGGFVPYEIGLFDEVGVQARHLGRRILRTESAVNAVLGRWLH